MPLIDLYFAGGGCWLFLHTAGNGAFLVAYRWLHILAALVYGGLLVFLNLLLPEVAGPAARPPDPALLRRVFALWRWSMMLAFFFGLNLLHMLYDFPFRNYFDEDKGLWMAVGASLGTLQWVLAWFWTWPVQKRHLALLEPPGSAQSALAPRAASGIRLATALMPPTVMGMLVGAHGLTLFSWGWRDVAWTFAVGTGAMAAVYAWLGGRKGAALGRREDGE